MSVQRTNRGLASGIAIAEIGSWILAKTSESRLKVYAKDPVNGKANYTLGYKNNAIDTHAGLDTTKMREERPELYKSIETYFNEQRRGTEQAGNDDADPYGDLALSRRQKLSPSQNWKRGLLQMRRIEYENAAVTGERGSWEPGIRMLWAANFGTKISSSDLMETIRWIVGRQSDIVLKDLLTLEQEYYQGELGTRSSEVLASRLATLGGKMEFDNVEEVEDGSTELLGSDGEAGLNDRGRALGRSAGQSVPAEADPFAAFQ